ncbi:hypothetical protein FEM03_16165 [Phragmitibacter flavus]|uniref:Uncharacterized protein n=1 Tax=Phragmitibacter flavus TaxID=2576071 RepID=A0A5R8KC04_9BACT|nr:hypothetical protein [Phragmitibacter flavus]TLD69853.1 hypothetical protein FEM03_16165 [Phragmitibacter flavus]
MKSHQLVSSISPELKQDIILYVQTETKEAFRTALFQIGAQRKLRPQYFQNKSRAEQGAWLTKQLELKTFDSVAEQILQLWLLKAKVPMLTAFLDAADIKHDGQGQVDDLPDELTTEQISKGVDAMLVDNKGEEVALYLHLFQSQRPDGWPTITEALESRPELKLGAA